MSLDISFDINLLHIVYFSKVMSDVQVSSGGVNKSIKPYSVNVPSQKPAGVDRTSGQCL